MARTFRHVSPLVICLHGEVGTGKTVFAKSFVSEFLIDPQQQQQQEKRREESGGIVEQDVTSPTFLLDNIYKTKNKTTIHHMDLYRLKKPTKDIQRGEIIDPRLISQLGIPEVFNDGVFLIEWAERLGESFRPKKNRIDLVFRSEEQQEEQQEDLEFEEFGDHHDDDDDDDDRGSRTAFLSCSEDLNPIFFQFVETLQKQ